MSIDIYIFLMKWALTTIASVFFLQSIVEYFIGLTASKLNTEAAHQGPSGNTVLIHSASDILGLS